MSDVIIPYRFLTRGGTAANLASVNEVPRSRELVFETDTGYFKIGDGSTAYNSLDYAGIYPASDIPITDAGGYFTGTNVEAALQELGAVSGDGSGDGSGDTNLKAVARFYDECYMAAITTAGWVSDSNVGTLSVQQSVTGMVGAYALTSGSGSGNRAGAVAPGFNVVVGSGEIRCRFRVKPQHVPSASQQSQYSLGLYSDLSTASSYRIRLEAIDSGTTGDWYLKYTHPSGSASSPNAVTLTAGSIVDIDLVFAADGTSVSVLFDEVLQDTLALPFTFDPMHPTILSRKSGATGVSSTLWVDKVLVEQDQ